MVPLALALLATAGLASPASAQTQSVDVDIVLVLEVTDAAAWIAVHEDVLSTPLPGHRFLGVSVAATTGGRRSITLAQPRFDIFLARGVPSFKVTLYGKMGIGEAVGALGAFEYALIQNQAAGDSAISLMYGLKGVDARMLEMYVTRP